jgi:hypothetical protein
MNDKQGTAHQLSGSMIDVDVRRDHWDQRRSSHRDFNFETVGIQGTDSGTYAVIGKADGAGER